ncbi:MAG: ABC transporter ATP-binding protein [Acidimicrobiales bacterium]|nr:ABC transporter ATP-binding protein [Acidimicrobiales bacterium]
MKSEGLRVAGLSVHLNETPILSDINFEIRAGETLAILGPSGCGKSTLLKSISGLVPITTGDIFWNLQSLLSSPVHKRGIGLMFQNHALFPHKTVQENVRFGLEMKKIPKGQSDDAVRELLDLVGLRGYESRSVQTLSGGESQRVALARALAPEPKLIMLDEPFNALDRSLRRRLIEEIYGILTSLGITTIHVTHDSEEASQVADSVLLMDNGKIMDHGEFSEVIKSPKNAISAELLGLQTLWKPKLENKNGLHGLNSPWGYKEFPEPTASSYKVLVRPENIKVDPAGVEAVVLNNVYISGQKLVKCSVLDSFSVHVKTDEEFSIGQSIKLLLNLEDIEILLEHAE